MKFVEVLIVVHQKLHSKIAGYVNKQYEHADGTKIEVVPVAENEGSLAALLAVRHRLKVISYNRDVLFYCKILE